MGETAAIEWSKFPGTMEARWNVVTGCRRKSPGCEHCYAERMTKRLAGMGQTKYAGLLDAQGRFNGVVKLDQGGLEAPLRWRKRRTVFVNSMSDWTGAPDAFLDRMFAVMALASKHIFILLTKDSKRMRTYMTAPERRDRIRSATFPLAPLKSVSEAEAKLAAAIETWPLPNVIGMVSAEDQQRLDERVPDLLASPFAVRGVSAEPLLGPLNFSRYFARYRSEVSGLLYTKEPAAGDCETLPGIDWVIPGGESFGRPCDVAWIRGVVDQCREAGVACFVKQLGTNPQAHVWELDDAWERHELDNDDYYRIRLDATKGGDWSEWPADLRVREFPEVTGAA